MNAATKKKEAPLNEVSKVEASVSESSQLLEPSSEKVPLLSLSDVLANADIGWYHILTMFTVFVGYCGRHALLDLMPVLSTRLYVEMDLTPELESALATVTFLGKTLSYLMTGVIANIFGRYACAIWGTVWAIVWNTLCAVSWNIESLIAFRLLWSFGSSE